MAEIISLNKARKAKERVDKLARTEANRAKFGRTKAQKQAEADEAYRRTKLLDDSKLE
ncbi:MAG: DUF4169 family protein [Sphingomonas sp.]|nr:DUF4169 family protein [Sphingomonas sp.]